ncbi:hypothetical protein BD410DRAFT_834987 [Rickenella mellea]|uniref:Uncharacterized protein n=1 Tax=Rickenella mellea TaxID=50990 RepID=A0A4Y7QNL2_9AGAM|nr:hypothetical protein BD410DRAFT_834987 [Rickenella mellea]
MSTSSPSSSSPPPLITSSSSSAAAFDAPSPLTDVWRDEAPSNDAAVDGTPVEAALIEEALDATWEGALDATVDAALDDEAFLDAAAFAADCTLPDLAHAFDFPFPFAGFAGFLLDMRVGIRL